MGFLKKNIGKLFAKVGCTMQVSNMKVINPNKPNLIGVNYFEPS